MSQDPDEASEKPHDPTQKKLDDARRRGEVPKSVDLTTAAAYAGLLLAMVTFGAETLSDSGEAMTDLLGRADEIASLWLSEGGPSLAMGLMQALATPLGIWLGLPALLALVSVVAQRALVVAPDRVIPKLNRISPIANAKNKYGRVGLFEFLKSALKLTLYCAVLFFYLWWQMPDVIAVSQYDAAAVLSLLGRMSVEFFAIVLVISGLIGAVDFLFQYNEHIRKNRMSRKELMDETKQTEGDPLVKQQRRMRAQEIALNGMLAEVPNADVVVVNPEHFAVALKWTRMPGSAPICVAKGVDEIAHRIKEVAAEAGVPIHRDPPTARALFATVGLKEEVRHEHYEAVAAAIRFAESMRKKARKSLWQKTD